GACNARACRVVVTSSKTDWMSAKGSGHEQLVARASGLKTRPSKPPADVCGGGLVRRGERFFTANLVARKRNRILRSKAQNPCKTNFPEASTIVSHGAGTGIYLMPVVLGIFRRALTTMAEAYTSGSASMAFVTVPNMEVAKKLSHGLVTEKLAACVNIIPGITSVYEWENKIEEDGELLLMIKTMTEKVDKVSEYVRQNHPYDCAEVISSTIDNGNPPYLKWIKDITMGGKEK
ncbi:hypothetical protein BaRGS_00003312, partial [Batillaria attramentaria]